VKRSWAEAEDHFDREFLPQYGNLRVDELTSEQITSRLFEIKERGSARTAKKLRAYLSAMFRVAMGKSRQIDYPSGPWLPSTFRNPMDGVPLLALREARSVALKVSALRSFLRNLCKVREDGGQILRLQLETCSHIGEVLGMQWSEIDWTESVWTLPVERSKNKLEHRVMLSRQSVALLESRRVWQSVSGFVFPAPRNPKRQIKRDTMMGTFSATREVLGVLRPRRPTACATPVSRSSRAWVARATYATASPTTSRRSPIWTRTITATAWIARPGNGSRSGQIG